MIVATAKKWTHYVYKEQSCGHKDWELITEPEFILEFESYDKMPRFLKYRANLIVDISLGIIYKDRKCRYGDCKCLNFMFRNKEEWILVWR